MEDKEVIEKQKQAIDELNKLVQLQLIAWHNVHHHFNPDEHDHPDWRRCKGASCVKTFAKLSEINISVGHEIKLVEV